ncbi:MAG: type II secretion system F family protein [Thermodesulfovibrionales bacterium]|nr:type II secretion system F family protein [Thermodesulfovibrionales bacterium]
MPLFNYKGYKQDGSLVSGVVEASGYNEAILSLKEEGVFISDINQQLFPSHKRISGISQDRFVPFFTRNLAILLSSGVTIVEALQTIALESDTKERQLVTSIKESVSSGAPLWRSLEAFPDMFPEFYIGMIQAGENSGSLDKVLMRLSDYLTSRASLKEKVKNALIYPIFMLCVSIVVLGFVFVFVIPKITKIFKDTNTPLPLLTKAFVEISSFMTNYWWLMFVVLILVVFVFERVLLKKKDLVDSWLLKLPGNIIQSLYYARFARILSYLLEGGVSMLTALKYSARATGNTFIERTLQRTQEDITEGMSLSNALKGFPPIFIQLVATGEKGGRLIETLRQTADIYEEEFNKRMSRLISIIEPSMIIGMGIIVCLIVLSVLLPLLQMNQLIK